MGKENSAGINFTQGKDGFWYPQVESSENGDNEDQSNPRREKDRPGHNKGTRKKDRPLRGKR